ncbi:hypothetical protein I6A84_01070 [Frankia sp. CNm7]|uniref:Uncharacterized protein n=1 Tax=Frankia nepalensis TaxID=1836974 RepID=A0A937REC4_9ACTN|nr:hypothetical protein [Frankia nepalensis]MBL7496152.1 hypothetical protein [Frankia nepalensis]MBL7508909.1 hypothetical protein [Frankia nepalensis]MBL7516749.1 hypothetical protein [Frankia nepalensis]MBL7628687.1 hypothetical protein [Frankia nepalensis]
MNRLTQILMSGAPAVWAGGGGVVLGAGVAGATGVGCGARDGVAGGRGAGGAVEMTAAGRGACDD